MNTYSTDTLDLAAFLWVKGGDFTGLEEDSPDHFVFCFSNPQLCHELEEEYRNFGLAPARDLLARKKALVSEMRKQRGDVKNDY